MRILAQVPRWLLRVAYAGVRAFGSTVWFVPPFMDPADSTDPSDAGDRGPTASDGSAESGTAPETCRHHPEQVPQRYVPTRDEVQWRAEFEDVDRH